MNSKIEAQNQQLTLKLKEISASKAEGQAVAAECRAQVENMQTANRDLTDRARVDNARYAKSAEKVAALEKRVVQNNKDHADLMRNIQTACYTKTAELEQQRQEATRQHEIQIVKLQEDHKLQQAAWKTDLQKSDDRIALLKREQKEHETLITSRGRAELAKLAVTTKKFETQLTECTTTRGTYENKARELQKMIDDNEAKRVVLDTQLADQARTHKIAANKYEDTIAGLQEKSRRLNKQVADYKTAHTSDLGQLSESKQKYIQLSSNLNMIQSELKQSRAQVDTCTGNVATLTQSTNNCNQQVFGTAPKVVGGGREPKRRPKRTGSHVRRTGFHDKTRGRHTQRVGGGHHQSP